MLARLSFVLAALCLAAGAQAQDPSPTRVAGTIELAEGDVLIEAKDGKTRAPKVGGDAYEGDTITTFPKAELHLHMADGASLILRENSKITITQYVADGGDNDRSLIDLAKGALRSITGWIGRYNRSNYSVRTPLVTIGVRGTDHEPTHLLPGDPRGEPGSYDKVNEGSAFMRTKQGVVEVPANRAAFHSVSARAAPRLLGAVPAFFRPGRHEQRFLARAQEIRKNVVQRRLERREFVRQRGPGARLQQRALQPQRAAPKVQAPGRPSGGKAPDMRRLDRPKPAAQAFKERRAAEKPQRPGGGKGPRKGKG
jgi:hypothetical protein